MEDPFEYSEKPNSVKGSTFWIYIDEGNDVSQIVYEDMDDEIEAKQLTNRLNNAIYKWVVNQGLGKI